MKSQIQIRDKDELEGRADILDSRGLRKHMEHAEFAFHLAARVEMPYVDQNDRNFEQTNNWGTAEVVYSAEELWVSRLIHLSNQSVL